MSEEVCVTFFTLLAYPDAKKLMQVKMPVGHLNKQLTEYEEVILTMQILYGFQMASILYRY